jgi:hypothetical protein
VTTDDTYRVVDADQPLEAALVGAVKAKLRT